MDLRTRKYIKNTGNLPKYEDGTAQNSWWNKYANTKLGRAVSTGMDTTQGVLGLLSQYQNASQPVASAQDLINNTNRTTDSIDGVSFDVLGDSGEQAAIDQVNSNMVTNTASSTLSGAASGAAVAGPWGAAAGGILGFATGIFGGNKAKKKQEEAARIARITKGNKNEYQYNKALTTVLNKQQDKLYGNLESYQLIGVKNGMSPAINPITKETRKVYNVYTPDGIVSDKQNAWFDKGEELWKVGTSDMQTVMTGKNDTARGRAEYDTAVFSNNKKRPNPTTGNTFAQDARTLKRFGMYDQLWDLLNDQEVAMNRKQNRKGLYKMEDGGFRFPTQLIPSIFNSAVGLNQMIRSNDPLSAPHSHKTNRYEDVLQDLDGLRINTLPIYNLNADTTGRLKNAIIRSGGLGAGQISNALTALSSNLMAENAKQLTNAQLQNNQYIANAATTKYQGGAQEAARETADWQWDYGKLNASHIAQMQNRQMGLYNIANAIREGYKNTWEKYMFDKMYNIYAQDAASGSPQNNQNNNVPKTWNLKGDLTSDEIFAKNFKQPSYVKNPSKSAYNVVNETTPAWMKWSFKDIEKLRKQLKTKKSKR